MILIDLTYNTNIYNKPLVQLIGVTQVRNNFTISYAFVDNEKAENYVMVLEQLKLLLGECKPNAFVTDRKRGLIVALTKVYLESKHLLCVWHMKRNIEANLL